jgi:hypothetical protein
VSVAIRQAFDRGATAVSDLVSDCGYIRRRWSVGLQADVID